MILTVTLNLGLDITYQVDRIQPHESHRVRAASTQAGGKGVNVARVLRALDLETLVMGLAGGVTGAAVRDDLGASGLSSELVAMSGENRRTVAVVSCEAGDATVFNEPGPHVGEGEWQAFVDRFAAMLPRAAVVVLAGSLPPGIPPDGYAVLTRLAEAEAVPVIVDASGEALRAAVQAGPHMIKPNADELASTTGIDDPLAAAAALRESGARAVVASLGPAGLLAVTPDGTWRARPPARLRGNPTGAGDACVAALAAGLAVGAPWPDTVREAVALSAAAVLAPRAGEVDRAAYNRFRLDISVEESHATRSDR